jgi:transcriptional regulator of arginine metabolism
MENTAQKRQVFILELIKNNFIKDQQELIKLLKKYYNISTNQTAISRDIQQLGISKTKINNQWVYKQPEEDIKLRILQLAVIDIVYNEAMIILKTIPGLAGFVGDYLDADSNLDLLGTVAGENMVFAAPRSVKAITDTCSKICKLINLTKGT